MRVLDMLSKIPRGSKTLMNIRVSDCHYPLDLRNEKGFRMYCAAPLKSPKQTYCDDHRAVMFYKPKKDEANE